VLRALDPARVPASCEQCGKIDLRTDNEEVWEFFCLYPGVMRFENIAARMTVDYSSVIAISDRIGLNPVDIIEGLEAIARGYSGK
jgi:hypothetical protein